MPNITMSRSDKILAMALTESRPPRTSHSLPSSISVKDSDSDIVTLPDVRKEPVTTKTHPPKIFHSLPVQSSISVQDSNADTVMLPNIQKEPISEYISKLWSRPLDYNDFKTIFDFRNEYSNSFNIVSDIHLNNYHVSKTQQLEHNIVTRHSLMCYEQLSLSDEDDNAGSKVDMFQDSDDSVKDKDYAPDCSTDSDSNLSNCSEPDPRIISFNAEIHNNQTSSPKYNHGSQKNRPGTTNQLEKIQKDLDVIIFEDILPEASTSQVIVSVNEENTRCVSNRAEKEMDNEETEQIEEQCVNDSSEKENTEVESPSIILPVNEKGYTKSGQPRKRRAYDTKLGERIKQKKEIDDAKLALKPPCSVDECRKKCTTKVTEEARANINDCYKKLNWESRGLFIKGMVEPCTVKTRTNMNSVPTKKRNVSYRYHFYVDKVKIEVCKVFFLTTLGYKSTNNRHIHLALNKRIDDQKDKRGSHERKNVFDKTIIKDHIQSFNPTISHYRREHAPNRLYLPSDLNITMMHQLFIKKYTNMQISVETYRKVLKEMNISFAHLGNEECEQCALHISHSECSEENCELCVKYNKHKLLYKETRKEYQNDKEAFSTDKDCIYYSVDLQKIIMLPRMEQFKSAIFCPRLIAFNESFVPIGSSSGTNVPFAVLWNESVSGRNQEDIISTYQAFFVHNRDVKHFVLWADNCAAQNKNWSFMCFLVNIVNSDLIAAQSITIKYFEPGHTFMSADHFHHQVEKSLKKKQKVYDFDDFVDSVKLTNSKKNMVKVMTTSDFYFYQDLSSQHKIRNTQPRVYLKNILAVKADRGQFSLKVKEKHAADWKELDFLQMKIIKNKKFPDNKNKTVFRGITKERKERIISELLPLMPETRRSFWLNLPESSHASNID